MLCMVECAHACMDQWLGLMRNISLTYSVDSQHISSASFWKVHARPAAKPATPPATRSWGLEDQEVTQVRACDCRQQLAMMGSPCWAASPAKLAACWMSWQMCWVPSRASQLHKRVSSSSKPPPPYRTLKLLPAAVVPLVLLRRSNQHFPSIAIWVMLLKHCIGPGQLHTASLGHSPCLLVLAFIQQFSYSSVPSCSTHVLYACGLSCNIRQHQQKIPPEV